MRTSRAGNSAGGFTLIELTVVLVIMGLMATIASVSLTAAARTSRIRAASAELVELLRYARQDAIARRHLVDVTFDEEQRRWVIAAQPQILPFGLQTEEPVAPAPLSRSLAEGLKCELIPAGAPLDAPDEPPRERVGIRFRPDGSADDADIILTNEYGDVFHIQIAGPSGLLRVL